MIEAVIFDLNGVLVEDSYRIGLRRAAQKAGVPEEQFNLDLNGEKKQIWRKFVVGGISENKFWEMVEKQCPTDRHRKTLPQFKKDIYKLVKFKKNNVDIFKRLNKKYKTILLTDHTKEWFSHLEKNIDKKKVLKEFDLIINSAEVGLTKKYINIFRLAIKKSGVSPESIVFIDDQERNINHAESLDMKGILYSDRVDLEKELNKLGVGF